MNITNLHLYIITNSSGQFFRSKGRSGYGPNWVDDIIKAKTYTRLGSARSILSYYKNRGQDLNIVELIVTDTKLIDNTEHLKKAEQRKQKEIIRKQKIELESAKRRMLNAKKELDQAIKDFKNKESV